ncbi:DUF6779 domain-containing protein [Corynebacterium lubricantis]|uniref:DUF6779 domain-containing protein n=1 Tax=Corynebacterium lubricantis TaxID=541095 RepID=UPI0003A31155|nr:DUF6779 domain-containing protein [Corynebacterium lubricantis]
MTEQNRTPDRGQIGLYALVGLAVLATIIMLFTDSGAWLKIALIAALWAAAVGFFLVYRSRKEKNEAEIQLQAAQQAHDAELKAVEASAEKDRKALELSQNQDGLSTADAELLKEIREELALVRAKLEELSGREFGYEPAALRAEARRIMEIQTSTNSAASTYPSTAETPIVEPEPVEPLESEVPKPQPHKSKAPSAEAVAGRVGGYEEPKNRESNPLSQLISERKNEAAKNEAAKKDVAGKDAPKKDAPAQEASTEAPHREEFPVVKAEEKKPEEKKPEEKKPEEKKADAKKDETVSYRGRRRAEDREPAHEQEEAGRRRRRSDENESGVSVAELMARMKAADKE